MVDYLNAGSFVNVLIVCVFGIPASAFIVAVNLLDWVKNRCLNTCDCILLSFGTSSVLYQCTQLFQNIVVLLWSKTLFLDHVLVLFLQLSALFASSSFWLTACLCVFYCLKIVDFNHPFLIWLKLRISKVVIWMLLGSVLGSLALSIPTPWSVYRENSTNYLNANSTAQGGELKLIETYAIVGMLFGCILPLLIDMSSITVILVSLYRHTQQMKANASEFSRPRLDAHYGAARMVTSLLFSYILSFLALIIKLFPHSPLLEFVAWTIIISANVAQSVILILGNTKLRTLLWKVLSAWKQ